MPQSETFHVAFSTGTYVPMRRREDEGREEGVGREWGGSGEGGRAGDFKAPFIDSNFNISLLIRCALCLVCIFKAYLCLLALSSA